MKCTTRQSDNREGVKFCEECGSRLPAEVLRVRDERSNATRHQL